ncbi:GNAT family N-acetyltransferase [Streptomyces sp. NPDC001941]|uniref:GNAT family N-acetyltransferase n=1 Tax=Streptomyces sp. NPDC001941 TaxID=3154659 RepID=UPI0033313308
MATPELGGGPAGTLFCGLELAARIERAETGLITAGARAALARLGPDAGFVTPLAGGAACRADEHSPLNKVVGLGFAGAPSEAELDAVERRFAALGTPVQVELAHVADPAVGELLTGRGYRLAGFENLLGREVTARDRAATVPDVEVGESGDEEFEAWLDTVVDGFAHPDTQGVASHEEFPRDVVETSVRDMSAAAGMRRYLARVDGVVAGAASMRVVDGLAQLTGAATLPAYRRRGVQAALLTARLDRAAEERADLAVITTQPASTSQHNAQRRGFSLLYTRAVLVR